MSDGVTPVPLELEASGETVGEAKWLALRELERAHPGLDRDAVSFEVLSEGERGLLGVGRAPARVIARLDPLAAPVDPPATPAHGAAGDLERLVRDALERICHAIGADCRVETHETGGTVVAAANGPGVGLLIGRNGRTIDAIQLLLSTAAHRLGGEEGRSVEIDAGSYRARRAARLTNAAQRAAGRARTSGEPVHLEPMTAPERKLVHTALQDEPGIETRSEGDEPARYVVVFPAPP